MFGLKSGRHEGLTIIKPDGGICSQIGFVALGEMIRRYGGTVKYDLAWYREKGTDDLDLFVRNWDFEKAFPGVKIEMASQDEIDYLKRHRPYRRGTSYDFDKASFYMQGPSRERHVALAAMMPSLRGEFHPFLDDASRGMLARIESGRSCAVHVRRGDLANGNRAYGKPASDEYFRRAILMAAALLPNSRFFFFSDEPDWVDDALLPKMPSGFEYIVVRGNGSDRGYVDLFLISRCDCSISSAGTLGVFGALLSEKEPVLFMNRRQDYALDNFKNIIVVKDDFASIS